MSSVWKRLQRVNKHAAKFHFVASYQELMIEGSSKWQPNKLCVIWTRRSRRYSSKPHLWEPTIRNPYRGLVVWAEPENVEVNVTLFKDPHHGDVFEDKEWTFIIEDISKTGKYRRVATANINMKEYASLNITSHEIRLPLKPLSKKVVEGYLAFTLTVAFLHEGKATDEDMQSIASLMSMQPLHDVGNLDDFDGEEGTGGTSISPTSQDTQSKSEEIASEISECNAKWKEWVEEQDHSLKAISQDKDAVKEKVQDHQDNLASSMVDGLIQSRRNFIIGEGTSEDTKNLTFTEDHTNRGAPEFDKKGLLKEGDASSQEKTIESHSAQFQPTSTAPRMDGGPSSSEEMLSWSREVTKGFPGVKITNLTTSFRNGMAFGAIIQHFRPDLIQVDSLSSHDIKGNCKKVFEAAEQLGIPKLIEPDDMVILPVPDKLAVLTYLYQLRAHFTKQEVTVQMIGRDSTYTLRRGDEDEKQPLHLPSLASKPSANEAFTVPAPTKPRVLMTRKQLTHPLDSDSDEEKETSNSMSFSSKHPTDNKHQKASRHSTESIIQRMSAPSTRETSPTSGLIVISPPRAQSLPNGTQDKKLRKQPSREEKLREEAKQILEGLKKNPNQLNEQSLSEQDKERHKQLTEKARELIKGARKGVLNSRFPASASIPNSLSLNCNINNNNPPKRTSTSDTKILREGTTQASPSSIENNNTQVTERITSPTNSGLKEEEENEINKEMSQKSSYVLNEIQSLEKEQMEIDKQAMVLERKLRTIMEKGDNKAQEDTLMQQWFQLVNKKNALIRRQMQLNILEKEEDLERRYELLNRELRSMLEIEDWKKTEAQKVREQLLLADLVSVVNKRDELVQHLDNQEKAIAVDEFVEHATMGVRLPPHEKDQERNCSIQDPQPSFFQRAIVSRLSLRRNNRWNLPFTSP